MAKSRFTCTSCGSVHAKWSGQCESCGSWNTIVEEAPLETSSRKSAGGRRVTIGSLSAEDAPPPRSLSGMAELDRVLGGGLVAGSAVLLGGDPGIGKSTLLLQAAARFASAGLETVYITGEEASAQVRLRAERLGLADAPLGLAAETNLRDVLATLDNARPALAIVDSIQTMWSDQIGAAPGSVSQVRAAAHDLTAFAKRRGTSVVLVGHVTKDGQIAGPRVVEHMVDTVLYFEGERGHQFRILRSVKNRFGPAGEIGVFEMTGTGLAEVANPSALFLADREARTPGTAVFAGIEGTRPLLVEIQALVAPSPLATPRRSVVGWDGARLAMILAVLEARCGLSFAGFDVYLNVAGGLRIAEPAADLAVAAALVSARQDHPLPGEVALWGEIALSGALRPVAQAEARAREALKLGFAAAHMPQGQRSVSDTHIRIHESPTLRGFIDSVFGDIDCEKIGERD
ncbi:MAG: DNA repair protein RadA [Pseudomonadota bacterium]